MILVDTNVVIDLLGKDQQWHGWSRQQLYATRTEGACINDIIYAELASRFRDRTQLEAALRPLRLAPAGWSREALFLAGQAFATYRSRGGLRQSVLPDFLIGAHAAADGLRLLTRDPHPYRRYFPSVALITP